MDITKAKQILDAYYELPNPKEEDDFAFTEALRFLIDETHDPKYMTELAWHYASKQIFDLEYKYLELAASYNYMPAMEELGYMYYYGQHGVKDYAKALYYFKKGAESDTGSLWCRYKIADMYKNGYGVEKDEDTYREMIEAAYEDVKNINFLNEPYPEIALRLAEIRAAQQRTDEAVRLLERAKSFMAQRLSYEAFWGHLSVMERIINLLYSLTEFKIETADFYDLFYLTKTPGKYILSYRTEKVVIEVVEDNNEYAIAYDGKWYRNFADFCEKAEIDGNKFTAVYEEVYHVEGEW